MSSVPMPAFTAADDGLHPPGEHHAWTETSWWSFNVPSRAMGGWLYVQVRPHQDSTAGGAFVWDAQSALPWELPFYGWFTHQRRPAELDLRRAVLPSGVSIEQVVAGTSYRLGYRFRDQDDFTADLRFDAIMPAFPYLSGTPPFSVSSHFDQPGRITGHIVVRGERIEVDCLSVRDRSWGPRPEHWGRSDRLSYAFGTADERTGFLVFCHPDDDDPFTDNEAAASGYLLINGRAQRIVAGHRRSTRDAGDGMVRTIELELTDDDDRTLRAHGESVSRMVLSRHRVTYNSLLRWTIETAHSTAVGYGEDQDLWPVALTADRARNGARS
jgi:hypothetical protein